MKKLFFLLLSVYSLHSGAQQIDQSFNSAFKKFAADSSFKHALISLYVVNSNSGKAVTEVNINIGMAPASCQKVITAAAAYELLGHDYSYKTMLGYTGKIVNGILNGDIIIRGSGDPTLGSWRYKSANEEKIISEFTGAISRQGINEITGNVYVDESLWKEQIIPDGWIWQDIGNYYGAGARALNWRENQYDLLLKSGNKIGDPVQIAGTKPAYVYRLDLASMATAAEKGSGDNANIYIPLNEKYGYVTGTIPVNENHFSISGSMPHPARQLALTLEAALKKLPVEKIPDLYPEVWKFSELPHVFYTYTSPVLDSIMFYFLKRSINLYGEALIKTLGYEIAKNGSTDAGVKVIKKFWKKNGIEESALNIIDGSGLSPANRVTTNSLVTVMEYASKQNWFPSFYNALPEISGIKMKSGSINGVVSYTGYIKGKNRNNYIFAFVINNYNGNGNEVRKKMWKLLREL
ncbi:MAG: D-alanyl-D-alanine carboxypeptidase/D-alanyl-D-alanine-endopeptidase [Bacteroidota bacterium]|nr:D-alanyl-D-alanine carboxypeptidase/D-alanyl-D-alanine-endopeptidase [Bacteroidota bacterium]